LHLAPRVTLVASRSHLSKFTTRVATIMGTTATRARQTQINAKPPQHRLGRVPNYVHDLGPSRLAGLALICSATVTKSMLIPERGHWHSTVLLLPWCSCSSALHPSTLVAAMGPSRPSCRLACHPSHQPQPSAHPFVWQGVPERPCPSS